MKYLSVFVFVILLSSTWYVINSEASVPLETHVGIQAKLSQIIIDAVKIKKPQATDVDIEQIWTEPYGDGQPVRVKAHFSYRYSEASSDNGKVNSLIEGEGILEKQPDDGSGMDKWSLSNVKTSNDSVSFEQAMTISTAPGEAEKDKAAPNPEAPAKNE